MIVGFFSPEPMARLAICPHGEASVLSFLGVSAAAWWILIGRDAPENQPHARASACLRAP